MMPRRLQELEQRVARRRLSQARLQSHPWQGSSATSGRLFTPNLISQLQRYGDRRVGGKAPTHGKTVEPGWGLAWTSRAVAPRVGQGPAEDTLTALVCWALPTCCRQRPQEGNDLPRGRVSQPHQCPSLSWAVVEPPAAAWTLHSHCNTHNSSPQGTLPLQGHVCPSGFMH